MPYCCSAFFFRFVMTVVRGHTTEKIKRLGLIKNLEPGSVSVSGKRDYIHDGTGKRPEALTKSNTKGRVHQERSALSDVFDQYNDKYEDYVGQESSPTYVRPKFSDTQYTLASEDQLCEMKMDVDVAFNPVRTLLVNKHIILLTPLKQELHIFQTRARACILSHTHKHKHKHTRTHTHTLHTYFMHVYLRTYAHIWKHWDHYAIFNRWIIWRSTKTSFMRNRVYTKKCAGKLCPKAWYPAKQLLEGYTQNCTDNLQYVYW